MNVPNALTILRIFFVPLLVAALVQVNGLVWMRPFAVTNEWLALAIFLAAAGTDLAGWLSGPALETSHYRRYAARSHCR